MRASTRGEMSVLRALRIASLLLAFLAPTAAGAAPDSSCRDVRVPYDRAFDLAQVPVPAKLDEALVGLKQMLPMAVTRSMYCGSEHDMVQYHFGLGRWMRNNWGLWQGGALAKHFRGLGVTHPDDMSGIILDSYWRQLHDRPIDLPQQILSHQEYWEAHASPPPFTCPNTGKLTEPQVEYSYTSQGPPQRLVVRHIVDCGDGQYWSYERNEGWGRASQTDLEHVRR